MAPLSARIPALLVHLAGRTARRLAVRVAGSAPSSTYARKGTASLWPSCSLVGERHEAKYLEPLLNLGRVKRERQGRPRSRPAVLVGDKGYSYPSLRRLLHRRHIQAVIPRRSDQGRPSPFDRTVYRERNKIERLVGRLKRHRRIATRYDKLAMMFEAWVTLACVLEWMDVPSWV